MALPKLQASSPEQLADEVKHYRRALGWSQQDLAEAAGCSRPTIARLESGATILSVTLVKVVDGINAGLEQAGLVIAAPAVSETEPEIGDGQDEAPVVRATAQPEKEPEAETPAEVTEPAPVGVPSFSADDPQARRATPAPALPESSLEPTFTAPAEH